MDACDFCQYLINPLKRICTTSQNVTLANILSCMVSVDQSTGAYNCRFLMNLLLIVNNVLDNCPIYCLSNVTN